METSQNDRLDLISGAPVIDSAADAGGCCGGGSCMCGTDAATDAASTPTAAEAPATAGIEFLVAGMTCGHCVSSVTEEVSAVAGVASVDVELRKGGASVVTVTADGPVDADAVRAAVEEAGYQLA